MDTGEIFLTVLFFISALLNYAYMHDNKKLERKIKELQSKPKKELPQWGITDFELQQIENSLDDTGGFLIKESELRYWINKIVNDVISKLWKNL
ncbi:MAG: hypothetical protein PHT07_21600 [Paludibacter sp.]|nr:hypothetical protein [Paludibacter sp.]